MRFQGGAIEFSYAIANVDMSGRLSCKVYMVNGRTLESNIYDVIDVRDPINSEE